MSIRPLTPELAAKAKEEINEKPERIEENVQHIKEWIKKQPHLRARTDDQWILCFLRGCKHSLERTKEKIDLSYTLRTVMSEIYEINPFDKKLKELFDTGYYLPLPKTVGPAGPRLILMRSGLYDPEKYTIEESIRMISAIIGIMMNEDDHLSVAGVTTILDLKDVTMGHFLQINPTVIKKMAAVSQDSSPFRQKGSHFINTPPGFETVYNFSKNLLTPKNRQRLYVHNQDFESFYKQIPRDVLPKEYGGSAGSIDEIKAEWQKKLEEFEPWFEEDKKYGTDESKRPGKPKSAESMFGIDGSFRKLDVD